MNLITSVSNTKIKQIVKLTNSRMYRYELGLSVVYGRHLIEESIKYNLLESVFIDQTKIAEYTDVLQNISDDNIYSVNDDVLSKINISDSATDIIGLIKIKPGTITDDVYENDCVILENIQDPGNLGTILRSCAATGVKNIVLSRSCVDPYNIKVLRSSQGIQFELNIIILADIAKFIDNYKYEVIATIP
ncbi:MAG TPA: TrmH family RNA methyltransferase, partial [Aquella sp.]|nr:TrmH family RNA methyltransferase [Aquella sp.]